MSSGGEYLSETNVATMIDHVLPQIRTPRQVREVLSIGGEYLPESNITKIAGRIRELLLYTEDVYDAAAFLKILEETWELKLKDKEKVAQKMAEERKQLIIDNRLPHVETAEDGTEFLNKWGSILSESEREQIYDDTFSVDNSARFLKKWRNSGRLTESRRESFIDNIFSRIETAEDGAEFLKKWGDILFELERKRLVDSMLSGIDTADDGTEFLKKWGDVLSESERHQIASKVAKSSKDLNKLRAFLSGSSYKGIKSDIRKARLKCLKHQLSRIFQ